VPSLRVFVRDLNGQNIQSRPLGPSAQVYCVDCHNSNSGTTTGPHGSMNEHILERSNPPDPGAPSPCVGYGSSASAGWSGSSFAMCDKCHDVNALLMSTGGTGAVDSFPHKAHIDRGASCTDCHDPHASRSASLINFDKRFVGPYSDGLIHFTKKTGARPGSCQLACHEPSGQYHNHSY
jgi:predicted CXXCH cytochrome family protein